MSPGARILKHFKVAAEKIASGKVYFSSEIPKRPTFLLTTVHSGHPSGKTACILKNPEKAGMDRKPKVFFSSPTKCLRIRARVSHPDIVKYVQSNI
jgi:hypothetical protein